MSEQVTTERIAVWHKVIILIALPLWVLQMLVAALIIESPGANNDWHLSTKYDFHHYYRTSERILSDARDVYCVPFSADEKSSSGLRTNEVREPTNPPLLSVALAPVALSSQSRAWNAFIILSCVATFGSLWFCVRRWRQDMPRRSRTRLLALIAVSPTVLSLFIYSQVQGFVLALCVVTVALATRRPSLSGISLGIAIALKFYTAPLLAFLFLTRRYRIFIVAVLTAVLGAVLPGYFDPRLSFTSFAHCGLAHVQNLALNIGNQGIPGTIHSFLEVWPLSGRLMSRETMTSVSKIAGPLLWLGSGVALGAIFRRRKNVEEGYLAALALCVICAPVAWPNYYILVWPYLIRVWRDISAGSKAILWLSFPLMPWYVAPAPYSLMSIFTEPPGTLLPWLPGTIFIIQFLAILWRETIRAHPVQDKDAAAL